MFFTSIILSLKPPGQTIHRALRQKHHGLYTHFMQSQQLGGRPHMPVGVPLHMSRAFLRWQHRLKCPASVVFLDLTEAFYRVVRVLALGGDLDDEHLAYIACHLGYSSDMSLPNSCESHRQLQELEHLFMYNGSCRHCTQTHGSPSVTKAI
jgi:hypothetical protein